MLTVKEPLVQEEKILSSRFIGVLQPLLGADFKEAKAKIEELIAQRAAAKKAKDFAEADRIRDYLLNEMGVAIKDTRQGVQWSRV